MTAPWVMDQITMDSARQPGGWFIRDWTDGQTQARISWRGSEAGSDSGPYERVTVTASGTLSLLGDITRYTNLELVSAALESRQV